MIESAYLDILAAYHYTEAGQPLTFKQWICTQVRVCVAPEGATFYTGSGNFIKPTVTQAKQQRAMDFNTKYYNDIHRRKRLRSS